MKIKGITSGTYLQKRIKNAKVKNLSISDICSNCKYKQNCKYKNITKFEKGKIFKNNVECKNFYFTIISKAILTTCRDAT